MGVAATAVTNRRRSGGTPPCGGGAHAEAPTAGQVPAVAASPPGGAPPDPPSPVRQCGVVHRRPAGHAHTRAGVPTRVPACLPRSHPDARAGGACVLPCSRRARVLGSFLLNVCSTRGGDASIRASRSPPSPPPHHHSHQQSPPPPSSSRGGPLGGARALPQTHSTPDSTPPATETNKIKEGNSVAGASAPEEVSYGTPTGSTTGRPPVVPPVGAPAILVARSFFSYSNEEGVRPTVWRGRGRVVGGTRRQQTEEAAV